MKNNNSEGKINITFIDNFTRYYFSFNPEMSVKQMINSYLCKINSPIKLDHDIANFNYNGLILNSSSFILKSLNEIFEDSEPTIMVMTRKLKDNEESKINEKNSNIGLVSIKLVWKNMGYLISYSSEITVEKMLLDIGEKFNIDNILDPTKYAIIYKSYILNANYSNRLTKSLKSMFGIASIYGTQRIIINDMDNRILGGSIYNV